MWGCVLGRKSCGNRHSCDMSSKPTCIVMLRMFAMLRWVPCVMRGGAIMPDGDASPILSGIFLDSLLKGAAHHLSELQPHPRRVLLLLEASCAYLQKAEVVRVSRCSTRTRGGIRWLRRRSLKHLARIQKEVAYFDELEAVASNQNRVRKLDQRVEGEFDRLTKKGCPLDRAPWRSWLPRPSGSFSFTQGPAWPGSLC